LLLFVCEDLLRKEAMSEKDDASSTHEKEIFNNFLQLISHEQQKRQQVSVYAGKLNITPKYLSAVCKKVSGKTPMRWITESVMEDCYNQLLKTDLSVKEIAHLLGFPNSSFFGQYFRDQAGVTPMEYRTQHKKIV
jgi:AraC-like DNA-binding protein